MELRRHRRNELTPRNRGREDRDRTNGLELHTFKRRLQHLAKPFLGIIEVVEGSPPIEDRQDPARQPGVVSGAPEDRSAEQHAGRPKYGGHVAHGQGLA
jgi:hypothetical protein